MPQSNSELGNQLIKLIALTVIPRFELQLVVPIDERPEPSGGPFPSNSNILGPGDLPLYSLYRLKSPTTLSRSCLPHGLRAGDEIPPAHDVGAGYACGIGGLEENTPGESPDILDALACLEMFHSPAVTTPSRNFSIEYPRVHRSVPLSRSSPESLGP